MPLAIEVNDIALKGLSRSVREAMRKGLLKAIENIAEDEQRWKAGRYA